MTVNILNQFLANGYQASHPGMYLGAVPGSQPYGPAVFNSMNPLSRDCIATCFNTMQEMFSHGPLLNYANNSPSTVRRTFFQGNLPTTLIGGRSPKGFLWPMGTGARAVLGPVNLAYPQLTFCCWVVIDTGFGSYSGTDSGLFGVSDIPFNLVGSFPGLGCQFVYTSSSPATNMQLQIKDASNNNAKVNWLQTAIPQKKFFHLALSLDFNVANTLNARLLINGILQPIDSSSGTYNVDNLFGKRFINFGWPGGSNIDTLYASLGFFAIWKRYLTTSEILSHMSVPWQLVTRKLNRSFF